MQVFHHHLLLPILLLFDLGLLQLFNHVITRNEHSLKELRVCEGLRAPEVSEEILLALTLLEVEGGATGFDGCKFILHLFYVGDLEVVQDRLGWFLRVLGEVRVFDQVVETFLGFPSGLGFFLFFHL